MSTMDHDEKDRDEMDRLLSSVEQMDDDALDAAVARVAADYNAPPDGHVRRSAEAMWAHIAAAQQPARHGMRGMHGHLRTHLHVQRWQLLAASVAFVALGITIGRQWSGLTSHAGAPASRVSHVASPVTTSAATHTTQAVAATPVERSPEQSPRVADADARTGAAHAAERSAPHARASNGASASTPSTPSQNDAVYQLATVRYFAAAEALLTSYDGSARDAKTDAQLASWAGDLLSQTRLLLDSPAGRDPARRRLLQDLELVLVQMTQLSPNAPTLEHELIDGSVRHNDIITRLHTAVPAGATTAL